MKSGSADAAEVLTAIGNKFTQTDLKRDAYAKEDGEYVLFEMKNVIQVSGEIYNGLEIITTWDANGVVREAC